MTAATITDREARRKYLHRLDRRRTWIVATFAGLLAGFVAVIFRLFASLVENRGETFARALSDFGFLGALLLIVLGASLGAFAGWLTETYCPDAAGSGIPQTKAYLLGVRSMRPVSTILVKLFGGLAALGSGLSLGREGPTIHMGGAAGVLLCRWLKVPLRSQRTVVAAGAGAGLAAAFNAPLAGFLFVMEELKREMSPITYGTALVASVASVAVARLASGQESAFMLNDPSPIPLRALPVVIVVAVMASLVGMLFNRMLLGMSGSQKVRSWPRWMRGALAGSIGAALLLVWPNVTGGGMNVAEGILSGKWDSSSLLPLAAGLLLAKLAMTSISYAAGVPGGIFAPILVMGSLVGLMVGHIAQRFMPGIAALPELMATVGMAAMLSSSVRAPLTGVVLIVELTGQYHLLYALLLAAFIAYVIPELAHVKPIYEALLDRDILKRPASSLPPDEADTHRLTEVVVEPDSVLDGRSIKNLKLPEGLVIGIIERDGQVLAPRGNTVLRSGDHLTVVLGSGERLGALTQLVEDAQGP